MGVCALHVHDLLGCRSQVIFKLPSPLFPKLRYGPAPQLMVNLFLIVGLAHLDVFLFLDSLPQ